MGLVERAEFEVGGTGLWKELGELGLADILFLWQVHGIMRRSLGLFRATDVLKHYRGLELARGLNRLLQHPAFKRTYSTELLCGKQSYPRSRCE